MDIKNISETNNKNIFDDIFDDNMRETGSIKEENISSSKKSILEKNGRNLNKLAEEGKLQEVIGRDDVIETIVEILAKKGKRNVLLTAPEGVGKTAIIEGLALKIENKELKGFLSDKIIYELDLASVVASTKYRGELEEKVKQLLNELKDNKNIILFIDEIHKINTAGDSEGGMNISNLFKPALARGEIQVIGATTLDEYKKYFEKDKAMTRRFENIQLQIPTIEESIDILKNIKHHFEKHHSVEYSNETIEACVKLSERYINERNLPDKAIDIMDQVGAKVSLAKSKFSTPEIDELIVKINQTELEKVKAVKSQKYELAADLKSQLTKYEVKLKKIKNESLKSIKKHPVTVDVVEKVISKLTGIDINKLDSRESNRLSNLPKTLKEKVIGQDLAVDKLSKAIIRSKVKINNPNKPLFSAFFTGQSGVGKTELAKVLNEFINNKPDSLVRVDMSEYQDRSSISRLIGAPAGFVGYEEGGQLTEKVRRNPYSVVLLDEIEKAHPDVWNIFLQVFDEGHLTDGLGKKINFKNTIIIMTSNVGARKFSDFGVGIGFNKNQNIREEEIKRTINSELKKTFSPEFLNRIDEIILFNELSKDNLHKIIDISIDKLSKRMKDVNYNIQLTNKAKDFLVEKGYNKDMGARPLNRAIQTYVEDEIAELIINGKLMSGNTVKVDYFDSNDNLNFKVCK